MRLASSGIRGRRRRHRGVRLASRENGFPAIGPIITRRRRDSSVSASAYHGVVAGERVSVLRYFGRSERMELLAGTLPLEKATAYMKWSAATQIRQRERRLPIASIRRSE